MFNLFVEIFNSHQGLLKVVFKGLLSVNLVQTLLGLHVLDVSESCDLSEHVGSLRLHQVDVSLEFGNLTSEVNDLIALGVTLISVFSSFKELLIQNSLGSGQLILELHVLP